MTCFGGRPAVRRVTRWSRRRQERRRRHDGDQKIDDTARRRQVNPAFREYGASALTAMRPTSPAGPPTTTTPHDPSACADALTWLQCGTRAASPTDLRSGPLTPPAAQQHRLGKKYGAACLAREAEMPPLQHRPGLLVVVDRGRGCTNFRRRSPGPRACERRRPASCGDCHLVISDGSIDASLFRPTGRRRRHFKGRRRPGEASMSFSAGRCGGESSTCGRPRHPAGRIGRCDAQMRSNRLRAS